MMTSMGAYSHLFVDSGAYIALADRSDVNHKAARTFLVDLGPSIQRVTSWGVVAETYTWLRYHLRTDVASRWLGAMEATIAAGTTQLVRPDPELDAMCRKQLLRFADHALSYVDGLTLAILQVESRIDAIFGFDRRHMALSGLPVLPATP